MHCKQRSNWILSTSTIFKGKQSIHSSPLINTGGPKSTLQSTNSRLKKLWITCRALSFHMQRLPWRDQQSSQQQSPISNCLTRCACQKMANMPNKSPNHRGGKMIKWRTVNGKSWTAYDHWMTMRSLSTARASPSSYRHVARGALATAVCRRMEENGK